MNEVKANCTSPAERIVMLPCPFCGGDAGVGRCYQGGGYYFVNCTECNASTDQLSGFPFTKKDAVELWNKRAT